MFRKIFFLFRFFLILTIVAVFSEMELDSMLFGAGEAFAEVFEKDTDGDGKIDQVTFFDESR